MSTATAQVGVRERPVLFSGPMVRAILDGQKTQTRRVVKVPVDFIGGMGDDRTDPAWWGFHDGDGGWWTLRAQDDGGSRAIACPYGQPGDRLWVKETFQVCHTERLGEFGGGPTVLDGEWEGRLPREEQPWGAAVLYRASEEPDPEARWRPSIHMPRWASRLTLEITDVRVERVQEITSRGAYAEGATVYPLEASYAPEVIAEIEQLPPEKQHMAWRMAPMREDQPPTPKQWFRDLWDRLNRPRGYGWDANPWCWVVSFRRIA